MEESEEIIIAMIAIVLAVTIAWHPLFAQFGFSIFEMFVVLLFAVGIGFMAHEMGHKWAAEKMGAAARFVIWPQGILFMFLMAPLGFIFAAPGAVYIFKQSTTRRENGLISIAGPTINIILYIMFAAILISSMLLDFELSKTVKAIAEFGMRINAFLAFFNLLPIFILDGAKVFHWNIAIWAILFIFAFLASFIFSDLIILLTRA